MRPNDVITAVADTFGVGVVALSGPGRSQHLAFARQAAMLLLRDYLPWLSTEEIGRLLKRDHTTVLYGVQAARERGRADNAYQAAVLEALSQARGDL